ncbi:MAG: hypothetical protein WAN65_09500 [Candidatus Sulfotelmatobacter sp.]
MRFKVPLAYLGLECVPARDKDVVVDLDSESRALVEKVGEGAEDEFAEVVESVNTKVFARVRPIDGKRTTRKRGYATAWQDYHAEMGPFSASCPCELAQRHHWM